VLDLVGVCKHMGIVVVLKEDMGVINNIELDRTIYRF